MDFATLLFHSFNHRFFLKYLPLQLPKNFHEKPSTSSFSCKSWNDKIHVEKEQRNPPKWTNGLMNRVSSSPWEKKGKLAKKVLLVVHNQKLIENLEWMIGRCISLQTYSGNYECIEKLKFNGFIPIHMVSVVHMKKHLENIIRWKVWELDN